MIATKFLKRVKSRSLWLAGLTATAALLVACGGGGGGGSASVGSGGTGATVSGPISGFGSIIVNGLRLDDSRAQIRVDDDDSTGSTSDLKLGMIVTVEGEKNSNGTTGTAERITSSSFVQGPISSITASQLTVFGVTVTVNARTLYANVAGLDALVANDTVEVHGFPDDAGGVTATRIEKKTTDEARLTGFVQADVTATTFTINGVTITYESGDLKNLPNGITEGLLVRVKGTTDGTTILADRVQVKRFTPEVPDNQEFELKGFVTEFTSATDFKVNGQPVTVPATAEVEGAIAENAFVEVEGVINNGILVARKVELEDENDEQEYEIHSLVANLVPTANTFVARNGTITVQWDEGTQFDDSLPQGENSLTNGLAVEVKGTIVNGILVATRIELDD